MYYVVTYDIASDKRLPKMLKHCRRYFNWVQFSVFEGELTESQIEKFFTGLHYKGRRFVRKFDKEKDSLIVYRFRNRQVVKRTALGIEKNVITNFI